jgi:hypothetical protein
MDAKTAGEWMHSCIFGVTTCDAHHWDGPKNTVDLEITCEASGYLEQLNYEWFEEAKNLLLGL